MCIDFLHDFAHVSWGPGFAPQIAPAPEVRSPHQEGAALGDHVPNRDRRQSKDEVQSCRIVCAPRPGKDRADEMLLLGCVCFAPQGF